METLNNASTSVPAPELLPKFAHSSALERLLRTNDPPLDSESTAMRNTLTEAESELIRIDDDIDSIRRRRVEVQRTIDDRKRILSSVRRLPGEMICEIVLHALEHYTRHDVVPATLDKRSGPWLFGQVCGSWRKAVLSGARIWSVVDIVTHCERKMESGSSELLPEIEILPELLRRSRNLPLDIREFHGGIYESSGASLLNILIRECFRWKSIRLSVDVFTLQMLNAVKGGVPLLEMLELCADNPPSFCPDLDEVGKIKLRDLPADFILDGFEVAPQLTSLTLDIYSEDSIPVSFPWCQLQPFDEQGRTNFLDALILARLPNVVEFFFAKWFCYDDVADKTITSLPKLRYLEVYDPQILDLLTLPGLKSLYLGFEIEYEDQETTLILSSFIHRSRCLLDSLQLPLDKCKPDILLLIPSLTHLHLSPPEGDVSDWGRDVSEVLDFLTIPSAFERSHDSICRA